MIRPVRRLVPFVPIFLMMCLPVAHAASGEVPVRMTLRAALETGKVRLSGTASVPDGAWIIYVVYRKAAPGTRANGFARVRGGRYAAVVDVRGWPPGRIAVDAHFQILLPGRRQPAAVIERFGRMGERMTGPTVVKGGAGFRAAVVSASVTKR
jgi:hypothetical protein